MSLQNLEYMTCYLFAYPPSYLFSEGLNQAVDAIVSQHRRVEEKLLVIVGFVLDVKYIWHKRVPVVKGVELRCDPVLVLETFTEEKFRIKFELQVVAAQMLHVIFDYDFDRLACKDRIMIKPLRIHNIIIK